MLADTVTFTDHGTGYYTDSSQLGTIVGVVALVFVLLVVGVVVLRLRRRS